MPASNILIMKVAEDFEDTKQIVENPEITLAEYSRKHVLCGEMLASVVIEAITESLSNRV